MCRGEQGGPFPTVSHNISREGGVQEKPNSCLTSCEPDRTYEGSGLLWAQSSRRAGKLLWVGVYCTPMT